VRSKTGRVYGNLMSLLTVMKGLPLSYSKDLQEDKEPLFDSLKTIDGCLRITGGVIDTLEFNTGRMEAVFDDTVFATDIADYLTEKGMPFRKAHEVAGRLVKWSVENGTGMSEIPMETFRKHSELFSDDVKKLFNLHASTDRRSIAGGTGKKALEEQTKRAKILLSDEDISSDTFKKD
ncbi:MAG: argininosuccinate lyase, partial [Candidatus Latescibacteria bacterium]|nr:argininosuccinate lyase [Candidatus Latescibacterota bacterium]